MITTAATVETAMTTMTTAPIMTPITHPDMCIAAAVSSVGEVGAEGSGQIPMQCHTHYESLCNSTKYQKRMKSNKVESHLIVL